MLTAQHLGTHTSGVIKNMRHQQQINQLVP